MPGVHSPPERVARAIGHALCVLGLLFLVTPILVVIPLSFSAESLFSYPMRGYSFRWYEAVLQSEAWQRALRNSLIVGLATTLIATALGAGAAIGLNRLRPRWRSVLVGIVIWKELKGCDMRVKSLTLLMAVIYGCGVVMVSVAPLYIRKP